MGRHTSEIPENEEKNMEGKIGTRRDHDITFSGLEDLDQFT